MINPYTECPRFLKCSVNNCPLHPTYPNLPIDPEDREQKCTIEKQVRFKIGSKYLNVLKYRGLTVKEWAGKQRFESLPEQDKERIRERAKGLLSSACQIQHTELGLLHGKGAKE